MIAEEVRCQAWVLFLGHFSFLKYHTPCFSGERVSHWLELLVRLWYLINKFQGSACLNLDK